MFRAEDYVKVRDLEEAYELCQKRSSLVVGGMVWMKMTSLTKRVIVDLSGLGLDQIEENQEEFRIGCMCSLRQMEIHSGLNDYFNGIFKECTRHIVGVQMRNCATVGGSIYGRFGFSDILTCMLALDSYVELYKEELYRCRSLLRGLWEQKTGTFWFGLLSERTAERQLTTVRELPGRISRLLPAVCPDLEIIGTYLWARGLQKQR